MSELVVQRLQEAMGGMKAVELVEKSGVSKNCISQYLNGRNGPDNVNATKLGKALGVNPLWLMGYDVPKTAADGNYLMYNGVKYPIPDDAMEYVLAVINAKK